MIDRLQKQRTRRVRSFAAGFFVFPGKWIPAPVAITGSNDNLGMCIYGSSI